MPSINGAEYLVILVVALLVFGPHRLPELTHKVGGWVREVRKVANDFRVALEAEVGDLRQPLEDLAEPIRDLDRPKRPKPISAGGPSEAPADPSEGDDPAEQDAPSPDGMLEWKGPVHPSGPTPDDARADFASLEERDDEADA